MTDTYKAVEVSAPGTFRVVERSISVPAPARCECGWKHVEFVTPMQPQSPGVGQDSVCHAFPGTKWWAVSTPWAPG